MKIMPNNHVLAIARVIFRYGPFHTVKEYDIIKSE